MTRDHPLSIDARARDAAALRETEWLLTSGHGAYAMGTASGASTRRYHGLLVGTLRPPVERIVALSCVRDRVMLGERAVDLASFRFASETGAVTHPGGADRLTRFSAGSSARWEYDLGFGATATRELTLTPGHNRCEITWRVNCDEPVRLEVEPMTALRGFHELFDESDRPLYVERDGDDVLVRAGELALRLEMPGAEFVDAAQWWDNFDLQMERARGFDATECLFTPGRFVVELPAGGGEARLVASLKPDDPARIATDPLAGAVEHVASRCPQLAGDERVSALTRATGAFVVKRRIAGERSTTILAGYPWFADWGRDAMIALPGLLLTTGRFEDAKEVLTTFARHERRGLVPNRFDDYGGEPHYNTVDASLWFLHAAREYANASGDTDLGVIAQACVSIVDSYRDGTDFGIGMDASDSMIRAGGPHTQLTWMDAKTGDVAHTPRHGKAVEINALWVHGLRATAELAPERAEELKALADRAASSFAELFWNPERGCLHDCLAPGESAGWRADPAVRLNQIFAASLELGPLTESQRASVVEVVRRELLTPMGLRTLAVGEPGYRGRYRGGPEERDSAYHNGTVWPWPIGAYIEASLRADGFSHAAKQRAQRELEPLLDSLTRGCLGQVAEVFDGDASDQRPGGCPAQAWSVAEVLRALALAHQ